MKETKKEAELRRQKGFENSPDGGANFLSSGDLGVGMPIMPPGYGPPGMVGVLPPGSSGNELVECTPIVPPQYGASVGPASAFLEQAKWHVEQGLGSRADWQYFKGTSSSPPGWNKGEKKGFFMDEKGKPRTSLGKGRGKLIDSKGCLTKSENNMNGKKVSEKGFDSRMLRRMQQAEEAGGAGIDMRSRPY